MGAADVLGLVNLLSGGEADTTVTPLLYTAIVDEWGAQDLITNVTVLAVTAQTEFTFPNQVRNVIGVIWDNCELGRLSLRQLESLNPQWRSARGKPTSFTTEAESDKTLALYPAPSVPSNAFTGGDPIGAAYPTYSLVLIHTEARADVMPYLELPLALLILEREFIRESPHRDPVFAQLAGDMGRALLEMIR